MQLPLRALAGDLKLGLNIVDGYFPQSEVGALENKPKILQRFFVWVAHFPWDGGAAAQRATVPPAVSWPLGMQASGDT